MKGKKECTHFSKLETPPKEAECYGCPNLNECGYKAGVIPFQEYFDSGEYHSSKESSKIE